jgi:hypothetical protein
LAADAASRAKSEQIETMESQEQTEADWEDTLAAWDEDDKASEHKQRFMDALEAIRKVIDSDGYYDTANFKHHYELQIERIKEIVDDLK